MGFWIKVWDFLLFPDHHVIISALGQNCFIFLNIIISRTENVIIIRFKYHCNSIPCKVFVRLTFFLYYNNIVVHKY